MPKLQTRSRVPASSTEPTHYIAPTYGSRFAQMAGDGRGGIITNQLADGGGLPAAVNTGPAPALAAAAAGSDGSRGFRTAESQQGSSIFSPIHGRDSTPPEPPPPNPQSAMQDQWEQIRAQGQTMLGDYEKTIPGMMSQFTRRAAEGSQGQVGSGLAGAMADGDHEALVRFLEDNRERKLFAFIHFFDVHEPFLCRKYEAAGDGPVSKPLRDPEYLDAVRTLYHTFHVQMGDCERDDTNYRSLWTRLLDHIGDKRHEHIFPLYVRGVTKFDRGRFRNFAERLSSSGLLDESLTIVFSDHGEGRSSTHDPDIFAHGGALYDSVIRVPLMVHHPDLSPRITDDVVSLVDIFPTIMNSCAVEDVTSALPYALDGANLLETGKRGSRYVYSETWQRDNRNQNIPLPLVSSLLEQRSLRSKTRKCVINGSRDSFPERGAWREIDDETFAQQAYRCLYGRYESLDEYRRTVEGLKEGIGSSCVCSAAFPWHRPPGQVFE